MFPVGELITQLRHARIAVRFSMPQQTKMPAS